MTTLSNETKKTQFFFYDDTFAKITRCMFSGNAQAHILNKGRWTLRNDLVLDIILKGESTNINPNKDTKTESSNSKFLKASTYTKPPPDSSQTTNPDIN
ncbi:MAG: hypothetical protein KAJ86_07085 [Alphaproteobacteria bacterium]|nr:hypothetical protein [Alphaproteobacteria bacterium]